VCVCMCMKLFTVHDVCVYMCVCVCIYVCVCVRVIDQINTKDCQTEMVCAHTHTQQTTDKIP